MSRAPVFMLLLAAAACTDKADDGNTDDSNTVETSVFDEIITVNETAVGELACWTAGAEPLSQTPDPSCQVEVDFAGEIEDFESGDEVGDATLELFFSDAYSEGAADYTTVSDTSGAVSGQAMTCTPTTYKTSTDPDLDLTRDTFEAHQVWGYETSISDTFNSVSSTTYQVIPSLLGVSIKDGMGIVAGTAYDCNGDPLQNVQVIARDASGAYPEDQRIHYFRDDFPNREQPYTSPDGLWVAINLPAGEVTIEMYAWNGTTHELIGTTDLTIFAESINVANIAYGFWGGVFYPDSCLSPCE